jgi:hypothetical protein
MALLGLVDDRHAPFAQRLEDRVGPDALRVVARDLL